MKKYLFTIFIGLIVGFFLCNFFLNQYRDYKGIKVSNLGEELYFIQYGIYSDLESLENNTINLQNYVYNEEDSKYYVYVGITGLEKNAEKILNYNKKLGNNVEIKKYTVTNKKFIEEIKKYDDVLKKARPVPEWLEKNTDKLEAKVLRLAAREDVDLPVEEHLIVELYSK